MIVVPGPSSLELGEKVAQRLGVLAVGVEHKVFPDGEDYLRLMGPVKDEDVAIIQTTSPPADSHLMQLLLLARTIKDFGARKVVAVVPYLAYARQDKRFLEGEALSIDIIIRLIEAAGIDALITFEIHAEDILERFEIPARSLSAVSVIAGAVKSQGYSGALSLSPDEGRMSMAMASANILGGGYDALDKTRDRHTGEVRIVEKNLPVQGRDVVVFDDVISTGGTLTLAVGLAKKCGARRIAVACTHPLLLGKAVERILGAGAQVILGTDSVPGPYGTVSLAPLIAEALQKSDW